MINFLRLIFEDILNDEKMIYFFELASKDDIIDVTITLGIYYDEFNDMIKVLVKFVHLTHR